MLLTTSRSALTRRHFLIGSAMAGTAVLGAPAGCGSDQQAVPAGAGGVPAGNPQAMAATPQAVTADSPATTTAVPDTAATGDPSAGAFEVTHTDDEWRTLLSPQQYDVLRDAGTEAPYSSSLNDQHGTGIFFCAGCALDLFSSDTKFDSGTGWPSFWQVISGAVIEKQDSTFGMTRTEVLCRRCGGHLGHVFDDGPQPTGLRYCMNGVAMNFRPTA